MAEDEITNDDRDYFGTDSKRFFERALLKSKTWEEGVKYAKELRTLQHPSLSAVQSKTENVTAIELRWSRPSEIRSNELSDEMKSTTILVSERAERSNELPEMTTVTIEHKAGSDGRIEQLAVNERNEMNKVSEV